MSDILRIGVSGLLAHQRALQTTGHNITNANTEGYNRQVTDFDTQTPDRLQSIYFGNGTQVSGVTRIVDQFVVDQIRNDASALSQFESFYSKATLLDGLLANPQTGIAGALDGFFSALQVVADDPSSIPARQVALSEAQRLGERFQSIQQTLTGLTNAVNGEFEAIAGQVNQLASGIAKLNEQISVAAGSAPGNQPNDLLDKRDQLLRELGELVGVSTVVQDNNTVNVYIGNGQGLVVGTIANQISIEQAAGDPSRRDISIVIAGKAQPITDFITGGKMGGLLDFSNGNLTTTASELGRLALTIAGTINEQHQLGKDLDGELGGLLFNDVNASIAARERAIPDPGNVGPNDRVIETRITDFGALTTSDYTLNISGGVGSEIFTLTRKSDGVVVATAGTTGSFPQTISADGLEIELQSGSFQPGDKFTIAPTRFAAAGIGVALTDPRDLALAMPVRSTENPTNRGSGSISPGEVIDTSSAATTIAGGALSPPLMIRFTSATSYDILDASDPLNPVAIAGGSGLAYVPGQANALFSTDATAGFPAYTGYTASISGSPQAGDEFLISYNTGGVSDNRNALKISDLQTSKILDGGKTTFSEAYAGVISQIASNTAQASVNRDSAAAVLEASEELRNSISGVNLDEEAADLIRFEQAYNASAQVIAVAQGLFDSLLAAVNR